LKIWPIIALVVLVVMGVAIYNSSNTVEPLYQTIIQPKATPKLAIDVDHVPPASWIYITATQPGTNLSDLSDGITIKVLRGNSATIHRAKDYGPAGGLTYSFECKGGAYRLEISFEHPEKWPELAMRIAPSP
jgi:hypothetical protein